MKSKKMLMMTIALMFIASLSFAAQHDYNIPDSPAQYAYDYNTYTELGWTDYVVTETDVITDWEITYTWNTDSYPSEGSFLVESPAATQATIASGQSDGTYTVNLSDFNGETMNGTWKIWIEDSYGDGGHQATSITMSIHYIPAGAPGVPTNPNPIDLATGVSINTGLAWTNGADTDDTEILFDTVTPPVNSVYDGVAVESLTNAEIGGPLSYGETYYWQVIAKNSVKLETAGPVWSFTTECGTMTLPFTDGFEAATPPDLPICWAVTNDGAGNEWDTQAWPTYAHSGDIMARYHYDYSNPADTWMFTPALSMNSGISYRVKFWYRNRGSYTEKLEVYICDGQTSADTLSGGQIWDNDNITNNAYQEAKANFTVPSNGTYYVGFHCYSDANQYELFVDDVTVEETPPVPEITLSETAHDFGFVEGSSTASWDVTITNTGLADLIISGTTVGSPFSCSYTGTIGSGLSDDATIYFNPAKGLGSYIDTLVFHNNAASGDSTVVLTGKSYPSGYSFESFEGDFPPTGWEVQHIQNRDWARYSSTTYSYDGSKCARLYYYYSGGYQSSISRLVTPELSIGLGDTLIFHARKKDDFDVDTLIIQHSADGVNFTDLEIINLAEYYQEFNVDLSSLAKGTAYLGFYGKTDDASAYIYLDAVYLPPLYYGVPATPTNPTPSDLATGQLLAGTLDWDDCQYAQTYDVYLENVNPPTVKIAEDITHSDTLYSVPNLNTPYYWKVVAKNQATKLETQGPVWSFTTLSACTILPLTEDFEPGFDLFDNAAGNDVDWILNDSLFTSTTHSAWNPYGASNENILIQTCVMDLTAKVNAYLKFWHIAKTEGNYDECYVEISTDAGATWAVLPASTYLGSALDYNIEECFWEDSYADWGISYETPDNTWWKQEVFDLTSYNTFSQVMIRFRLTPDGSGQRFGWLIDDVYVYEPAYGAIEGIVSEYGTKALIENAVVTIGTQSDTTNAAGYYLIESVVVDTYNVTCTHPEYFDSTKTGIVIIVDETVTVDFDLWWAEIAVNPDSFNVTLDPLATLDDLFTITNNGPGDLTYSCAIQFLTKDKSTFPQISIPRSDGKFPRGNNPPSIGPAPENVISSVKNREKSIPITRGTTSWAFELLGDQFVWFDTDTPGTLNNIGAITYNPYCADYGKDADTFMYIIDDNDNHLKTIDVSDGSVISDIGLADPGTLTWTGISCDKLSGIMYASATDVTQSKLYTIDLITGAATLVGDIGVEGIIDIAIDGSGTMYGYCIINDASYTIDKSTGTGTLIGSIGFDANYAQGMSWDPESDNIYLAAYDITAGGQFRVLDPITGNTALIGAFPAGTEVDGLGYPGSAETWLSITNNGSGTVPGTGKGFVDVTIHFDAAGLQDTTRTANIVISSNAHSGKTTTTIPATMNVNPVTTPPGAPTDPDPYDGEIDVDTLVTLSWTNHGIVDSSIVWWRKAPPFPPSWKSETVYTNSFTIPDTLLLGKTYEWYVVCYNAAGNTTGPTWSFTTWGYGNLEGIVYYDDGTKAPVLLENAVVTCEGVSDTTDGTGYYFLNGIPSGDRVVTATKWNWQTTVDTVTIVAGSTVTHDIEMFYAGYTPRNLTATGWDSYVDLEWGEPLPPTGEIHYDDGTAEAWFWLTPPSSTDYYFYTRFNAIVNGTVDYIAVLNSSDGADWNAIMICPDDGTGKPDLASPYQSFPNVPVTSTTGEWELLELTTPQGMAVGDTFYVVTQWPDGSYEGPYVGTDTDSDHSRCAYTVDGGTNWNMFAVNWIMRAFMSTPKGRTYTLTTEPTTNNVGALPVYTLGGNEKDKSPKMAEIAMSHRSNTITMSYTVPAIIATGTKGDKGLTNYKLYRGTISGSYSYLDTTSALTYTDNTVVNCTEYFYVVTAVYDEGESGYSNEAAEIPMAAAGIPYFSNFDAKDDGGFYDTGEWECGAPTYVDGPTAYSSPNVWGTDLDSTYSNDSNSWLFQPFDLSAKGYGYKVNFAHWDSIETNWDFGHFAVDHDNDGVYNILATYTGYNTTWTEAEIIIPDSLCTAYTKLAFIFTSDGSNVEPGFYIDNLSVDEYIPPQISIDPTSFTKTLLQNNTTTDTLTIGNPARAIQEDLVYTATVSGAGGAIEDFEATNGGYTSGGTNNSWEWGTPNYGNGPATAHSGTKCWGTNLTGDFNDNEYSHVESTPFDLTGAVSPELVYYHWFDMGATCYDGVNLKVSNDGGTTWTLIIPDCGYTCNCSNLDNEDVFGGYGTGTWDEVRFNLSSYVDDTIIIRWRLGTSGVVPNPGYYLDDVEITGLTQSIWLTLDGGTSTSDTISVGNTDDIEVGFDATGLVGDSTYTAKILITSNDPDSPTDTVAVTLNVDGPPEVLIEMIADGDSVRLSWVDKGYTYYIYSNDDPYAVYPGTWFLEDTVSGIGEVILPTPGDKKFYIVIADTAKGVVAKPVIRYRKTSTSTQNR